MSKIFEKVEQFTLTYNNKKMTAGVQKNKSWSIAMVRIVDS